MLAAPLIKFVAPSCTGSPLAMEVGVPLIELLSHSGLDETCLRNPDDRIPLDAVIALFREFYRRT